MGKGTAAGWRVCDLLGPYIKVSPTWEKRLRCNRMAGHVGPHQHRNPETFAIVGEWSRPAKDGDERERRKVSDLPAADA